jgi:transglutaminase-like putative cysteine protease
MRLHITHETHYAYSEPVKRSVQSLRLTPRQEASQRALNWTINAPGKQHAQVDAHGNVVHLLTLDQPHREIRIVVSGTVDTDDNTCFELHDQGSLSPLAYLASTTLTRPDAALAAFAHKQELQQGNREAALLRLAGSLREHIEYIPGVTDVRETAAQAFERRKGVCQDHAHAFVSCCRASGIPARYVSGYLYTGKDDEVASHAWADAWLGSERGWLGIDVTHGSLIGGQHCRLAVGRDYLEACPVRGVRRGGGEEAMKVEVSINANQQ